MTTPLEQVLSRLDAVRGSGERWTARCPSHDDRSPSLSIGVGEDDRVLLHCHGGCSTDEVMAAIGMTTGDLFADRDVPSQAQRNGAATVVATYNYTDEEGNLLFQVCRRSDKQFPQRRPDGKGGWKWGLGDVRRVLYQLPRVIEAVKRSEAVFVVEGEKDVASLERIGVTATCAPGGARKWSDAYSQVLCGARVAILPDCDGAGREHSQQVAEALVGVAREVRVLDLDVDRDDGYDVSDLLRDVGDDTESRRILFTAAANASLCGPARGDHPGGPFAMSLEEFIATKSDTPPALIGDDRDNLLPAFGLMLLVAKGGKGKTTISIDGAFHLASGADWLGFKVERPLRLLFIENEGPQEPFRQKLALKAASWERDLRGAIYVYAENWGAARLNDDAFVERLNEFVERHEIDVVIGDPLDSLGMDGVGSPEDTRNMVARFQNAGLFSRVAWIVLHHSRKDSAEDAIDEVSGAWGGRADSMLLLEKLPGNRAKLRYPKVRWSRRGERPAQVLAFDPDTEAFVVVAEECEAERDYVADIEALLAETPSRTAKEIAAPREDGGIGARLDTVKAALADHPDRFVSRNGKEVGRHPSATCWDLASGVFRLPGTPETPTAPEGTGSGGVPGVPALKGTPEPGAVPRDTSRTCSDAPGHADIGHRPRA